MGRLEQGRFNNLISRSREQAESVIKFGLERYGFVQVKNREEAESLRLLTQRSLWALKGFDFLLDLLPRSRNAIGKIGIVSPRLFEFRGLVEENRWRQLKDPQMRGILERILAVPSRKTLLYETLGQAFSFNLPREQILSTRERLEQMLDVVADKQEKPAGGKKAMILTQTAYLLGKEERQLPYGFDSWLDFGVKLGGGTLPYLGAAVVYSELMNTGEFGEIEIADFRDEETIERLIDDKNNYDLVLVSGATTYDTFLIAELNKRLSAAGLQVLNGGIAATISVNPERFLQDGASVFIGEFEGAAEAVLERLEAGSSPTIFIRGKETAWGRRLKDGRASVSFLENLPRRVNMEEAYSVEREREGYLARRLEALAMMRPMVTFADVDYEPPPIFRPHETNVSYGCPNSCVFCATVKHSGREMRARSIASVSQEWEATEPPFIGIVDQNLTANGRSYVESLLKEAERLGKKVAFEGELNFFNPSGNKLDKGAFFFDGSEDDDRREKLLKKAVLAIAVGLEQPIEVKGSRQGRKDPMDFAIALKKLNNLGLITFGTAMIGLPKELWSKENQRDDLPIIPLETMSSDERERILSYWLDWFNDKVPSPGAIPFAFTLVPGTPAYEILRRKGKLRFEDDTLLIQRKEHETDLFISLNPNLIKGIDSRRAIEDLRRRLYAMPSIMKRMRAAKFSPKKFMFMLLFNLAAGVAIRDRMI